MENEQIYIIIIEDEAAHVEAIKRTLCAADSRYEIKSVSSILEFKNEIILRNPSLVITDLNLPDGKAFEILPGDDEELNYPILVMTAYGDEEIAVHAMKLGAQDYLVKSHEMFSEMPRIISQALREWNHINKRREAEKALIKAKEEAEAASRAKSIFMANMSHELRTPLNGILGMASLLETTPLNPKQSEFLALLTSSAKNLFSLIQELLDFNKIASGSLKLNNERFDIGVMVQSIIEAFKEIAEKKGLEIKIVIENDFLYFMGDRVRTSQIITNLISNAIKYTEHGFISVIIKKIENHIEIVVIDTGIGISETKIKNIFNPFNQLEEDYLRTREGMGLGLAITRQLVELMNGKITVESSFNKGSKFRVILPYNISELEGTAQAAAASELNKSKIAAVHKILIVEDEIINMMYLSALLDRTGFKVEKAYDGIQAVSMASENNYSLILMDIGLPEVNGIQATEEIRKLAEPYKNVPIIALTAHAYPDDKQKCLKAGMNGFITKPLNETVLFNEMWNVLK